MMVSPRQMRNGTNAGSGQVLQGAVPIGAWPLGRGRRAVYREISP
jgi:hypothetical protein